MSSVISNKRIVKNSVLLYFRMFFLMAISLFTARVVLRELGVVDYGIFNVVGSVVAMCSFLTGSLTAASNRFFSMEVVKKDGGSINKFFCLNLLIFFSIFIVFVLILETGGLWYVNNKMVIPLERLEAAHWVYQCSVVTLGLAFLQVPYVSLITTHEHMGAYAYISIFEGILKLLVAYLLMTSQGDKLKVFSLLMLCMMIATTLCYYLYCRKNFSSECRFHFIWEKRLFVQLLNFTSIYFLGTTSYVVKSYGINLMINSFFSPTVNAARAISVQVESAVVRLSDGFFTATRPQLYKAYSVGEYQNLYNLISRTTIITVFLMSVLAFPFFFNAKFVLSLWLGIVPDYTIAFLHLILIEAMLNSSSNAVILTILATGHQKKYQIFEFTFRVLVLPIAYLALRMGCNPESTVMVGIVFSFLAMLMRAIILHKEFNYFMLRHYLYLLGRLLSVNVAVYFIVSGCVIGITQSILLFFVSSSLSILLLCLGYGWFVMLKSDRTTMINIIKVRMLQYRKK